MTDSIPSWLAAMRDIDGTKWAPGDGPNPKIVGFLSEISTDFPQTASYCASVVHDDYFSWCGLAVGYCMAKANIAPVFGSTDTSRFLFAMAWLNWGTAVATPQLGDVLVFDFGNGDHHVTFFEKDNGDGTWACHGGNQSHAVNITNFPKNRVLGVRRPAVAGAHDATTIALPALVPTTVPALAAASQRFAACVKLVLVSEGGNDDDPRDPGGRTSRGITQNEWNAWLQTHPGLPSDVFQAPQDQVIAIYKAKYWDALSCDSLPAGVDYAVFDYGVLSGVGRAARILQGLVGAAVDGEIGPQTIAATANVDPATLINKISDERLAFLQSLSTFATFGKGWTNRVEGVRAAALAMAAASGPAPVPAPDQIAQSIINAIAQIQKETTMTVPGTTQVTPPGTSVATTPQNTGIVAPQPDLGTLLQQLLALGQTLTTPATPSAGATPAQAQDQVKQIVGVLNAFLGAVGGQTSTPGLGQVNGALGQTIGNLLNGNKSAIGIIGALATQLLPLLGTTLPLIGSTAGFGQIALPVFLAIAAWGVLGKFEKWLQPLAPQAAATA